MCRDGKDYEAVMAENAMLKKEIEELRKENRPKNERGAGRKPQNHEWMERYDAVMGCITEGLSYKEAMERLSVSQSTYYRFRRICLSDIKLVGETAKEEEDDDFTATVISDDDPLPW